MFDSLFFQPTFEVNPKLIIVKGNLFDGKDEAIAHGCNTIGVMGAGIAKQFRLRYPEMFRVYHTTCVEKMFQPGDAIKTFCLAEKRVIYCLATQNQLGAFAKLEWIEKSLRKVLSESSPPKTLGIPMIGAGIGGLDSKDVLNLFHKLAAEYPNTQITVYQL